MLPKLSQCTARFVYVLSPPVLHKLKCNLYHINLCYRSFQMRYNKSCFMQTAIAPMRVKDRITKHWDSFGSHCISFSVKEPGSLTILFQRSSTLFDLVSYHHTFAINCHLACLSGLRTGLVGAKPLAQKRCYQILSLWHALTCALCHCHAETRDYDVLDHYTLGFCGMK